MRILKKIKLKTSGIILITVLLLAISVHILVLLGVLPYNWINGGRVSSMDETMQISTVGIITLSISIFVVLISIGVIPVKLNKIGRFFLKIYLWILTLFMFLSIFLQLLGTTFEMYCMSILVIVGFITALRLAIEPVK